MLFYLLAVKKWFVKKGVISLDFCFRQTRQPTTWLFSFSKEAFLFDRQVACLIRSFLQTSKKCFFVILLLLCLKARPGELECKDAFPSGLQFVTQVGRRGVINEELHSQFFKPEEEHGLQKRWNEKPSVPSVLDVFLPKGAHYIGHQLAYPEHSTAVQMNHNDIVMVRASYEYNGLLLSTNVAFRSRVLLSNIKSQGKRKWLVGSDTQAVILFLHGMGRRTAGAHVAKHIMQGFRAYKKVDVLSLDLPWHAEGHREVFKNLEEEILALSAFVKKYVPPHVPLFVLGHSGGSVFAQKLMTMTDGPQGSGFFHPQLKGIMLLSPVVDPAPGKSVREKQEAFSEGQRKGFMSVPNLFNTHPIEYQSFEVSSPLGELYGMWNIVQLNAIIPSHRGKKYIPTLMAVGTKDPFIFTGFPSTLFHQYFDKLENVETHYFERLPLLRNRHKVEEVGHNLGEYRDPSTRLPIPIALAQQFMEKHLGVLLEKGKDNSIPASVNVARKFANNLAFREFLINHQFLKANSSPLLVSMEQRTRSEAENEIKAIMMSYGIAQKHQGKILKGVLSSTSAGEAIAFLTSQFISYQMLNDMIEYVSNIAGYWTVKHIKKGVYVPSYSSLLERGFKNPQNSAEVSHLLSKLSQKIISYSKLKKELIVLEDDLKKISVKYEEALQAVQQAFGVIEQAIKQAETDPPSSLKDQLLVLEKELKETKQAHERVIAVFEQASVYLVEGESSLQQMEAVLKQYAPEIHAFNQLYERYRSHRRSLRWELIKVVGRGEMGSDYQNAVANIYGHTVYGQALNGQKGVRSGDPTFRGFLYLQLDNINQKMAQVEADLYNKRLLSTKLHKESQDIFAELFRFLKPVRVGDRDWIDLAGRAYTFSDVSIYDILKPMDLYAQSGNISAMESQISEKVITEYEPFFQSALSIWKQFNSGHLPDLPLMD